MMWTWAIQDGAWQLQPQSLPSGLSALAFRGRRLEAGESRADPGHEVRLGQVHGTTVRWAHAPGVLRACDAVRTRTPGLTVTIRTADCLPVLLLEPTEGLALVHAGWRGLVAGVLEAALATFPDPARVSAVLGPAIGPCCFEVGDDVAKHFPNARPPRPGAKVHVDLARQAGERLTAAGVPMHRIAATGLCTRCHQHLLHSHRGSGGAPGRVITLASLAGSGQPHAVS